MYTFLKYKLFLKHVDIDGSKYVYGLSQEEYTRNWWE